VFWYVWNNDSDSAMLTTVSTALELNGSIEATAPPPPVPLWPDEATRSRLAGGLFVSFNDGSSLESRESLFADVRAEARFFTDSEGQTFEHEEHGLSLDGFLVPPNRPLLIRVGFDFWCDFRFWDDGDATGGGHFDRIACPGVIVIASPVQTIQ
jgi:hypothetical protein